MLTKSNTLLTLEECKSPDDVILERLEANGFNETSDSLSKMYAEL